jgi:putative hydrolase of the HAD superfamily
VGAHPKAVLLDCLGTLVGLEPPAPRLAAALGIGLDEADRRMREEIAYYREHMHAATNAQALADLRRRCAAIAGTDVATLMRALVFTPYPEAFAVLAALRARGARLVVVSNWDVSLHEVLARTGLTPLLDGAISSAEAGAAKPDPALLHAGLALAGARPQEAVMIGDSPEDEAAARAAGVTPISLERPRVTLRALVLKQ